MSILFSEKNRINISECLLNYYLIMLSVKRLRSPSRFTWTRTGWFNLNSSFTMNVSALHMRGYDGMPSLGVVLRRKKKKYMGKKV